MFLPWLKEVASFVQLVAASIFDFLEKLVVKRLLVDGLIGINDHAMHVLFNKPRTVIDRGLLDLCVVCELALRLVVSA